MKGLDGRDDGDGAFRGSRLAADHLAEAVTKGGSEEENSDWVEDSVSEGESGETFADATEVWTEVEAEDVVEEVKDASWCLAEDEEEEKTEE